MSIRQLRTAAEETIRQVRSATEVAAHAAAILEELGDPDASRAVHQLALALPRTPATVVVAGDYKAGKTSLVNAILGQRIVPADPLATTPTPVRISAGAELRLAARVRSTGPDGAVMSEQLIDRVGYLDLSEADVPAVQGAVLDHLDVRLEHPLLELGLVLVDTPSISGGITSDRAGVVLGQISAADVVLFVADASQELTAPQVEFIEVAASLAVPVVLVMTKVDLYRAWPRLLERNHDHLEAALGAPPVIFGVSSALRRYAVRYGEEALDTESGLPLLVWYLVATVLSQARQRAIVAAGEVLQRRLAEAEDSVAASRRALGSAKERRLVQAQLASAAERAAALDQQWQPRLRSELDRFQLDVDADLGHRLQFVARLMNQTIDTHDPDADWPLIDSQFHEAVNRATAAHLGFVKERAQAVYAALEGFLGLGEASLSQGRLLELDEQVLSVDLDRPDLAINASMPAVVAGVRVSRYAWVAGSAVGAAFTPVGWIAVLAGAVAGLGVAGVGAAFWRDRARSLALEESRRRARAQAQVDVGEAARAAGLASRAARAELNARIQDDIVAQIAALKARLHAEVQQLTRIADVADEHRPAKDRELEELLERIRQVRAHAARLRHRVERPSTQVPAR